MKNRNKWTEKENEMLQKIVLDYIENGKTKTAAYHKASKVLGRTAAACRYRWNIIWNSPDSTPSSPLQLPPPKEYSQSPSQEINLDRIIAYLETFQSDGQVENLQKEKESLMQEQAELKNQGASLGKTYRAKLEIYEKLLQQYEAFTEAFQKSEELLKKKIN